MPSHTRATSKTHIPRPISRQQPVSADLDHLLHAMAFVLLRRQMREMRTRA